MKVDLFDYPLPGESIARYPTEARDGARLLVVRHDVFLHEQVRSLPALLPERALIVVNDTRVRKARVLGRRLPFGGKVELLMLGPVGSVLGRRWHALGRANKPLSSGTRVDVAGTELRVLAVGSNGVLEVEFPEMLDLNQFFEHAGHVPIPPYLERGAEPSDEERYQTVYAGVVGSAAAPTAGLHFTREIIDQLSTQERRLARLTLEVGLGTFRPVTVQDLDRHPMHAERFVISEQLAGEVRAARARGAPVVAIGTSVVRALESAADPERVGAVRPMQAETRLLIQPGYRFRVVDALFTNFHQPRSTLLALVSAFAGSERIRAAYREALDHGYRFLSYGDAMWIPERAPVSGSTRGSESS